MADVTPVFILSLPRSGSTLLQRMLMTHPAVASVPEPWLLLPIFYARRKDGITAEYWQTTASTAVNEFIEALPDEDADFHDAVNRFARDLYSRASADDARYFVDKTPRYHLVVDELFQAFPDGKFIFLWRNPLAIIASMIESWDRGRWNVGRFEIDLDRGLRALMKASQRYGDRSISVNYEMLLESPEAQFARIREYLHLDSEADEARGFASVELEGSMGDPTGTRAYDSLSSEPLEKWREVLNNPLRKAWCRRYLSRFGAGDWQRIGYGRDELYRELSDTPSRGRHLPGDCRRMLMDLIRARQGAAQD